MAYPDQNPFSFPFEKDTKQDNWMPTKTLDRTRKAKICKFDTDQRQFFTPEPNPNCNNAYNILDLFVGSYCSKIM